MGAFRRLLGAARFGFAVAAVFVCYQFLTDSQSPISRNSLLMLVFVALCPPSLLSIAFDSEPGTRDFYALWTVIGLMNAGLYTAVRLFFSRRLERPN